MYTGPAEECSFPHVIECITINLFRQANSITFNLFLSSADTSFMGKEQISIRLEPEILRQIDNLAVIETRNRNNMIELLIFEAISDRLLEQMDRVNDPSLEGEALDEEIKRARALVKTRRGRTPKKPDK
jgi:hypothetical protein